MRNACYPSSARRFGEPRTDLPPAEQGRIPLGLEVRGRVDHLGALGCVDHDREGVIAFVLDFYHRDGVPEIPTDLDTFPSGANRPASVCTGSARESPPMGTTRTMPRTTPVGTMSTPLTLDQSGSVDVDCNRVETQRGRMSAWGQKRRAPRRVLRRELPQCSVTGHPRHGLQASLSAPWSCVTTRRAASPGS